MRTAVALLFAALALLFTGSPEEQHVDSVASNAGVSCVREHPAPRPDSHAVLRAPGVGVTASPTRPATLVSSGTLHPPSPVQLAHLRAAVADVSRAPQFRRFPLLI